MSVEVHNHGQWQPDDKHDAPPVHSVFLYTIVWIGLRSPSIADQWRGHLHVLLVWLRPAAWPSLAVRRDESKAPWWSHQRSHVQGVRQLSTRCHCIYVTVISVVDVVRWWLSRVSRKLRANTNWFNRIWQGIQAYPAMSGHMYAGKHEYVKLPMELPCGMGSCCEKLRSIKYDI